jgi:hypothetical protein
MTSDPLILPRKLKVSVPNRAIPSVVVCKSPTEKATHVLMKAFLWALYAAEYPALQVEVRIGDRYKPDVIAYSGTPSPYQQSIVVHFWGECGEVSLYKIEALLRRYPRTHFAIAKWDERIDLWAQQVQRIRPRMGHTAPFDVLRFSPDCAQYLDVQSGLVSITWAAVARLTLA